MSEYVKPPSRAVFFYTKKGEKMTKGEIASIVLIVGFVMWKKKKKKKNNSRQKILDATYNPKEFRKPKK